ncbi:hypothetical protein B0H16DRAFT_346841 [Mycena metata]|uniref:Thiaminase-2/PQQC domain-containing protein n=1 Tax=Mycena metata TaxID=1033252 RepID=A0AAD7MMB4_9AGAR|nr:hypothetical protein B0H16DRAFT_346841 [Mycena metata]
MSGHPIPREDKLISIVTTALKAAEVDAAAPDSGLTFRPEWRPESKPQRPTVQPPRTPDTNEPRPWYSPAIDLSRSWLQQDQPLPSSGSPTNRTPSSEPASSPVTDAAPPPRAASAPASSRPPGRLPAPQLQEDAVAELVKRNQDVFDEVINHSFPRSFGKGTASLDGFRYYMIQDKMYLETCARLKMRAVSDARDFEDIETFGIRHNSSLDQVKHLKEICVTTLGIPEKIVKDTPRTIQLTTSEEFYKLALRNEDAYLGYYVTLLPCVLTYWMIADRLMNDPSTVKNAVYHEAWTIPNHDRKSMDKYTKFINENIAANGGVKKWNTIFRIACKLESDIFNTGMRAPAAFQIIPDGIYSIHVSSVESVVLAIQDIEGFRLPLGERLSRYLPSDARSAVVGVKKTGGDREQWHVLATEAGYTFKNLGTGLYLGISTAPNDRREHRVLQAVSNPYSWWINPVSNRPDQGPSLYQIFDSANLGYTLHAAIDVLRNLGSTDSHYTPIIAHDNFEVACQMWSFIDKFRQLEPAQISLRDPKSAELTAEKRLLDKYSSEVKNLKEEVAEAFAAMNVAFQKERTKMQHQMQKLEEENNTFADSLAAAREDAKKERQEAAAFQKELHVEQTKMQHQMKKLDEENNILADRLAAAREDAQKEAVAFQKELHVEQTKMQQQMKKLGEEKNILADSLAAAREDAKKEQQEVYRKIYERDATFDLRVKEMEKQAMEGQMKLKRLEEMLLSSAARRASEREKLKDLKQAVYRKHPDLLRAEICHWESIRGDTFHADSLTRALFRWAFGMMAPCYSLPSGTVCPVLVQTAVPESHTSSMVS